MNAQEYMALAITSNRTQSVASDKVNALTQADILRTASNFTYTKKMPKWTVVVNRGSFLLFLWCSMQQVFPRTIRPIHTRPLGNSRSWGLTRAMKANQFDREVI